jgi:hypothetical protein
MTLVRLKPLTSLFVTCLAVPVLLTACGENGLPGDPTADLCCKDFVVGADMTAVDFGLEGQVAGEFTAFAQAGGDLSAVATGALDDVAIACENIARDLGADPTDAEALTGKAATTKWCELAAAQISAKFSATGDFSATLDVQFEPPKCSASVNAQASCEGSCSASASCDAMAEPPMCTGGKLTVECSGSCSGSASASVSCTGECSGTCEGSCTAQGGVAVDCQGKCEGTCAAGGMGNGTGIQADGSCDGTCEGTCTADVDAPAVMCTGSCSGKCSAECTAAAGAKFTCDGTCDGDFEAPKCEGGKLELACEASADCKANCSASASAKAECTPPSLNIVAMASGTITADVQAQMDIAIASLKANLPNLLVVVQARGTAFTAGITASVQAGGRLTASIPDLSVKAGACVPAIVAAIASASGNFTAAFEAAGEVTAAANVGG